MLATSIRNIVITEQKKKEISNKIKLEFIVGARYIYLRKAASPPTQKTTSKRTAPIPKKSKYRKKFQTIPNIWTFKYTHLFAQETAKGILSIVEKESY